MVLQAELDSLLNACHSEQHYNPSTADLNLLARSLAAPDPNEFRSTAYIALGLLLNPRHPADSSRKNSQEQQPPPEILRRFSSFIEERLIGRDELETRHALHLLEAVFHIDGALAANFLSNELVDDTMDAVESFPASQTVLLMSAKILSQAAGRKQSRDVIGTRCVSWLQRTLKHPDASQDLKAATANALLKLSIANDSHVSDVDASASGKDDQLVTLMRDLVLDSKGGYPPSDALEGLAHASVQPTVKETLSRDAELLTALFSLVPEKNDKTQNLPSPLFYGLAVIINNLVAFRPRLSEQDSQIAQLRELASKGLSSQQPKPTLDILDDDDHVRQRTLLLVRAGCLAPLRRLAKISDSPAIRQSVAKAYLNIIEIRELRGFVLQTGGSKALLELINKADPSNTDAAGKKVTPPNDVDSLIAIQALAKLCITASPQQVFGPDGTTASGAVQPLSQMLLHDNSTLLQKFESLMALTNLVTLNEDMANKICRAKGLMDRVEFLLLADHELVRRAAVELLCNLVGSSEEIYQKFGGGLDEENPAIRSKVHILIALSDVEDVPTRLAASGVLAIVSTATGVCDALTSLQADKKRVVPILLRLLDDSQTSSEGDLEKTLSSSEEAGLFLRGCTCLSNVLQRATPRAARQSFADELLKLGVRKFLTDGSAMKMNNDGEVKNLVLEISKHLDDR